MSEKVIETPAGETPIPPWMHKGVKVYAADVFMDRIDVSTAKVTAVGPVTVTIKMVEGSCLPFGCRTRFDLRMEPCRDNLAPSRREAIDRLARRLRRGIENAREEQTRLEGLLARIVGRP